MNGEVQTAVPAGGVRATGFLRRLPIKWKLIAIILLLTLFGLAVVFTGMTVNNRVMFERRLANDLAVLADIIGNNSRAALSFNDPDTGARILAALRAKPRVVYAILYDGQGRSFATYRKAQPDGGPHPILADNETGALRDGYFAVAHDILLDGRPIGRLYLATDLSEWDESLRNYTAMFGLLALLAVGLTLALAVFLQRIVTGPIGHLAETARAVSRRKDYHIRAMKTTGDELGVLVDGFNEMLREIQRRDMELLDAQALLEQRVAERTAELRASELRFRAVADSANDAIISADNQGRVVYFNRAAERIFGRTTTEMFHRSLTLLMPPRYRAAHEQGLARFLAGGESEVIGRTLELAGKRKNGEEFPLELSLSTWKVDEEVFFTGVARDITQRRQAEERIRQLNENLEQRAVALDAANKELEAFSYSVSHDLRAPLRALDGFSRILLDEHGSTLNAAGRDYLGRVRRAAQHMAALIDDLLKLSRVTRAELSLEEVDLGALAQEVAEGLRGQDLQRSVRFDIAQGLTARADPRLLHIALENLLGNAWKFTSRRSEARIEFGATVRDDKPAFFVRDNGVGFDMAYAEKLFGAFQRLHDTTEFPGTGIGLATVQRIVHKHGGRIWAEAAVDRGATFYFTLAQEASHG